MPRGDQCVRPRDSIRCQRAVRRRWLASPAWHRRFDLGHTRPGVSDANREDLQTLAAESTEHTGIRLEYEAEHEWVEFVPQRESTTGALTKYFGKVAIDDEFKLRGIEARQRERIESFIEEYEWKPEAGSDMDISIRGQRERLEQLQDRIDTRRAELKCREQIISLAPTVDNYCLTFPL